MVLVTTKDHLCRWGLSIAFWRRDGTGIAKPLWWASSIYIWRRRRCRWLYFVATVKLAQYFWCFLRLSNRKIQNYTRSVANTLLMVNENLPLYNQLLGATASPFGASPFGGRLKLRLPGLGYDVRLRWNQCISFWWRRTFTFRRCGARCFKSQDFRTQGH